MLEKIIKAAAITIALSGCVTIPKNPAHIKPQNISLEIETYYDYKKINFNINQTIREENKYFTRYNCNFEINDDLTEFYYYKAKSKKKTPIMIISPVLAGNYDISKIFAKFFAYQDISSVIMKRPKKLLSEYSAGKDIENTTLKYLQNTRRVIDWLEKQPNTDANKIGAFGISMGGINTAMLASIDNRIKCSVISIAGSDIPAILTTSKESSIACYREQRTKKKTLEEFQQELIENIKSDPKVLAKYIDTDNALLFIALFDQCVPTKQQFELYNSIGGPKTGILLTGHYTAILALPYVMLETSIFLNKHFK
ncbi:prolyl oligopeptidase family serine peptidase [Candidatus Woesearchaeota archaeon]|nr:prolyl oligopeptidase family serine peptidase [Candidatus Woesearchaeota archaeon]